MRESEMAVMMVVVPVLCTVFSLIMILSPIGRIRMIIHDQSVGSTPLLPYLSMAMNGMIWTMYGFLADDWVMKVVNGFGMCLGWYYLSVYYVYVEAKLKHTVTRPFFVSLMVVGSVLGYVYMVAVQGPVELERARFILGLFGSAVVCVLFASPLSSIKMVIRQKSTASMDFLLSVCSLVTSMSWMGYGLLVGDVFMYGPNGIGVALCCIQLGLFVVYGFSGARSDRALV